MLLITTIVTDRARGRQGRQAPEARVVRTVTQSLASAPYLRLRPSADRGTHSSAECVGLRPL